MLLRGRGTATKTVLVAKDLLWEELPFRKYKTALDPDTLIVIFSHSFITLMRAVLSNVNGPSIVHMNNEERELYYLYVMYVNDNNDVRVTESKLYEVIIALDKGITNELNCKTESFNNMAFNTKYDWAKELNQLPNCCAVRN